MAERLKSLRLVIDERHEQYRHRFDALKDSMKAELLAVDRAAATAQANAKEAVLKAEEAIGERLALLNESKRTIEGLSKNFATTGKTDDMDARIGKLETKIEGMGERKKGAGETWSGLMGILGLGISLVAVLISYMAYQAMHARILP